MNNLVDNLTQKDEAKAIHAARVLIDTKNLDAFKKLCEKSEFLFDFVKDNVRKRLKTAIKQENFHNIITFFNFYCEEYADTLIEALSHFADEDLSDKIFELLENGTIDEKNMQHCIFAIFRTLLLKKHLKNYLLTMIFNLQLIVLEHSEL